MATGDTTTDATQGAGPFTPLAPTRRMTEDEFVAWSGQLEEGVRAEWVDGDVIMMSPVNSEHARISFWFLRLLADLVEQQQLGEVFGGDVAIRFEKRRRRRVPDGFFVARERLHLLTETYLDGAPDMVLEVVSPDSHERDWRDKHREYEKFGVREYWVVDPQLQRAELNVLGKSGEYEQLAATDGWLTSQVVPGFRIRLEWLWAEPRPAIRDALAAMAP